MTTYRRYDKRQKLAVVMAAEVSGVTAAAESTGIPKQTIHYWLNQPEFVQFRTKTRDDLADEIGVVAHLAWQRTAEGLRDGKLEPRDVLFAAEKATSLQLLMRGEPTARTETRSLIDDLDDHETEVFGEVVRAELARRADLLAAEAAVEGPAPT